VTEDFVLGSLSMSPVAATAAGYHLHAGVPLDELLDDLSETGVSRRRAFLAAFEKRLSQIDRARLTPQDQADYDLLAARIRLEQFEWNLRQGYKHDPTIYTELIGQALFAPYTLEYAPRDLRFFHIARRLETVPALLKHAQRNLTDSPEAHREAARASVAALVELIEKTLTMEAPEGIREKFRTAAVNAATALREYDAFLAGELASRVSDWRLGPDNYERKFQLTMMSDRPSSEVLADAERAMEEVRAEMARLGGKDLRKTLDAIAQQHARREDFLAAAQNDLEEATQFVKAKVLLPLPDVANLRVVATPPFQRAAYPVGGFNPAPPLQPSLEAQYWLTPIPSDWPTSRAESKLREYNVYGLKLLTIHEAMPGHYVQFQYASTIEPRGRRLLRALYGSGTYIEGWAVYSTHMMIEEGYLSADPGLRLTFLKQMLRVISNAILDIRLHAGGMTDEDAMKLMIDGAYQEREEAEAKLRRAKLTSCQLPTYFVGWVDFLRLRTRFRGYQGKTFLLPKFHEAVLREGALPVPAVSMLLTGQPLADRAAVSLIPEAAPSEE
jgi:uncharacterized protein (DUF885 family)